MLASVDSHPAREAETTVDGEECRFCGRGLFTSVFDTAFRDASAQEHLFFAVPGALCVPCKQLFVDHQLLTILGLRDARCIFAIESDRILQARAS